MRTIIILLTTVAMAAPAQAARQTGSLTFTASKPDAPTGAVLDVEYADGPRVTRVVTSLAPGARYDTSVPEQCEASDEQLQLFGEQACPAGSIVGRGWLEVDTGAGLATADVTFFNRTNELIFLNTVRGTPLRTVLRAPIEGTSTTSEVPFLPGVPPEGGRIERVHFEDFTVGRYITTPPACATGTWISTATFTYSDGVTESLSTASPCEKPVEKKKKRRKIKRRSKG
jgi:hypothetical protein